MTHVETNRNHKPAKPIDLDAPSLYINRELSWLQFNNMVLEEACDPIHPLLERAKFLAIFANNLDEFFMIRVSGLRRQLQAGALELPPDAMSPAEQLAAIRQQLLPQLDQFSHCWRDDILPKLQQAGIQVLDYGLLKKKQRKLLRHYFKQEIFPVLTPLAFDPGHPFPHISNLSLNLAIIVNDPARGELFARLKIPDLFPRLLSIPSEEEADSYAELGLVGHGSGTYVWIEEVIAANLAQLFPGLEVIDAYPFRVTRDADIEIEEDEASDLLSAIEDGVEQREFGSTVRLQVGATMPPTVLHFLMKELDMAPYQVFQLNLPLAMRDLMELTAIQRSELKNAPFLRSLPPQFAGHESLFDVIRRQDIMLYHPYDSFAPVLDFLEAAATDPNVVAIKQTLYRVGQNAPVVAALLKARERGKQVAVLVELKARFDEENNIGWARALEQAGVHVVYGLMGLKTHAKICMVVRRERDGIKRYVHISTGNYNAVTANIYTDLGFFTSDEEIGDDVSALFNALTGYSRQDNYHKLLVAPGKMRTEILQRIEREITQHKKDGSGYLAFKMNALVDKASIQALYRASQAGVKVDLQVRGICCLRPGVPGVSDNIKVTSIVGRFLEHPRIYYFHNGGDEELLLGSADLMPRNLDRRVEILFPVEEPNLLHSIRDQILAVHLRDNVKARQLLPDGHYRHLQPAKDETALDSQQWMLEHKGIWHIEG